MRIPRAAEGEAEGMGLTPLIDVVFLLLIFFVVATSFDEPTLAITLPGAQSAAPGEEVETLRVEIRATGELIVDGGAASAGALGALLAERADRIEALELRADAAVTHGRVVEVLDLARLHDVTEIRVAVEARPGPEAVENP